MSQQPPINPSPGVGRTPRDLVVKELERRIETLEALDDSALGRFTTVDWVIVVVGSVVIPAVVLWWFAG